MTRAVYTIILIIFFLLAGAFPVKGETLTSVFRTLPFMGLALFLSAITIQCSMRRKFRLRQAGFLLTHLGAVTIFAGAFTGFFLGIRSDFIIPLIMEHKISQLPLEGNQSVNLDFAMSASNFKADFYEPVSSNRAPVPSHFSVDLSFSTEDGSLLKENLRVNHPAAYKGWRFYLMSYDQQSRRYVVLSARKDPGRGLVIAGIWAVIAGIALLCWKKQKTEALS